MSAYLDGVHKDLPTGAEAPVVVAALGPKMLELSGREVDGRGALQRDAQAHRAGAKKILGPNKILAVEQKVTIETDPAKARALGRKELARYMVLPNYRNNWLREGFSEADLANGGSDKFIDAMCLWGDAATVKKGLRAHFDAGATHVCLQPVHDDGDFAARDKHAGGAGRHLRRTRPWISASRCRRRRTPGRSRSAPRSSASATPGSTTRRC